LRVGAENFRTRVQSVNLYEKDVTKSVYLINTNKYQNYFFYIYEYRTFAIRKQTVIINHIDQNHFYEIIIFKSISVNFIDHFCNGLNPRREFRYD